LLLAALAAPAAPVKPAATTDAADHWAYQPLKRPSVPTVRNPQSAIHNPIDSFILAKLQPKGLALSPPASPEMFIRRLYFDLIGLPPTPEEVEAFVREFSLSHSPALPLTKAGAGGKASERESERRGAAVAALVDRLLSSPHYGERWGRHWLDLARFAETDGYEHDAVRPHSWRYRDYVVRAFNEDKPYDRFIREQLAGDELFENSKPETRNTDLLVATGFLLLGPDMVDSADQVQRRVNTLNDMTDTVGFALLGLTLACARCHDHKFEPFSQRDYFAMQAHFTPAAFKRDLPIPTPAERAAHEAAKKQLDSHPVARELAAIEEPVQKRLVATKLSKLSTEAQDAHRTAPDKRNAEQANLVLETEAMLEVTEKELAAAVPAAERSRRRELLDELKKLVKLPPLPMAMTVANSNGPPAKTFILRRGEYSQPGEEIGPGFPAIVGGRSSTRAAALLPAISSRNAGDVGVGGTAPSRAAGGRTALADWLVSPDNPLTARVMVNRIWQHHFGRGLVSTPSDFGTRGSRPTHPDLLDWLASEFIARGWSVKEMHRLVLRSETYRQGGLGGRGSTRAAYDSKSADATKVGLVGTASSHPDPSNSLNWHFPRIRLEGEVVRDTLLAVSGRLNKTMGGPGVFPPIPAELFKGAKGWTPSASANDHTRRSLYIFARRNLRFPFLEVFDAPDSNLSCPERLCSTTAPQSLTLLNAEEVLTAARALAARIEKEAATTDDRITLAYRLAIGRKPTATESQIARDFLATSPLSEFCRVLFNLNAFVYVE
jgi:hypothetical protein